MTHFIKMARNLSYFTALYEATKSPLLPSNIYVPGDRVRGIGSNNDLFTSAVKQSLTANKCRV